MVRGGAAVLCLPVGLVTLGLGLGLGLELGVGQAAMTAAGAAAKPTLIDAHCNTPGVGAPGSVRPARIILACGDGNAIALGLTWQRWGATRAAGTGALSLNDCTPDCAEGHFHSYPARFTLSDTVRAAGRSFFVKVAIRFTGKVPPTGKRVETTTDCYDNPPMPSIPRCPAGLQ
jgi:hypothetical protein